jgi:hypothetical protein
MWLSSRPQSHTHAFYSAVRAVGVESCSNYSHAYQRHRCRCNVVVLSFLEFNSHFGSNGLGNWNRVLSQPYTRRYDGKSRKAD